MKKAQTQIVVGWLREKGADQATMQLINNQLGRGRYLSQIWYDIARSKNETNKARVRGLMNLTGVQNTSSNRKWERVSKRLLQQAK
jgi:hypothetical protein